MRKAKVDREKIDALIAREEMHSTAMAGGLAFPHPRHPLEDLQEPLLAVLVVASGVDYGAPDEEPTYLFVCTCAPDDRSHVTLLGRLAHMFRTDKAMERIRQCDLPSHVIDEFRTLEALPHNEQGGDEQNR